MLRRTEGIVLKSAPLGEADLIVTFLTRDFGIVRTFAKSPRKIKSRFGSSLEPLTFSRISFWGKEDAALPRLTQCDILHSFQSVRGALTPFLKASEIVELTLNFIPEREASKNICSLLLDVLHTLESRPDPDLTTLYYKVKLLESSGYLPRLNGCGRCGKKGEHFFLAHGTVLCEDCSRAEERRLRVSPATVRFYETLLGWDLSKISRIRPSEGLYSDLSRLIDVHVRYVSERKLKTRGFERYRG